MVMGVCFWFPVDIWLHVYPIRFTKLHAIIYVTGFANHHYDAVNIFRNMQEESQILCLSVAIHGYSGC